VREWWAQAWRIALTLTALYGSAYVAGNLIAYGFGPWGWPWRG
jgi:hypothetical protein